MSLSEAVSQSSGQNTNMSASTMGAGSDSMKSALPWILLVAGAGAGYMYGKKKKSRRKK